MKEARTLSISIGKSPAEVYGYLADPSLIPEWSLFITAIRPDGEEWIATAGEAEVRMRFYPRNAHGILDHEVVVTPVLTVRVPLRVVANEAGSEVIFTVFRQDGMSEADFERDMALVRADLENLKQVLERGREP